VATVAATPSIYQAVDAALEIMVASSSKKTRV
jgi:hypothetical protein